CGDNYIGEYCQDDNPCRNGFCMNDGKCDVIYNQNGDAKAECTCPVGFVGKICDLIDTNSACFKNPCRNGGKCIIRNTLTNYTCKCLIGFRGQHCEKEDYCASMPCRNGGSCSPNEGGFECACLAGYRGVTCMEDVDECAQDVHMCKNGGRCKNMYGSYQCQCTQEYTGTHCEDNYIPCLPSPCQNNGTCNKTGPYSYECFCPSGRCQQPRYPCILICRGIARVSVIFCYHLTAPPSFQ
ncbi:neurogenic locus notch protein 1, partial [Biomphalaria pfeifferi]